jgi:hypothetical protein
MPSGPTPKQRALLDEFQSKAFDLYAPDVTRTSVAMVRYENDNPVPTGTGVLLHIGERHFLLSAAHVLDLMPPACF